MNYRTVPMNLLPNGLTLLQQNPDCATRLEPEAKDRAVVPSWPRTTVSTSPARSVMWQISMLPPTSSRVTLQYWDPLSVGNSEP